MTLEERADLAERLVPVACELVCAVRDDPDQVQRVVRRHRGELHALVVVLAAMVPDDRTPQQLLGWADWTVEEQRLIRAGVAEETARVIAKRVAA